MEQDIHTTDDDKWAIVSRTGSIRSVNSIDSESSSSVLDSIVCQGLLNKEAEYCKTWRSRYFILYRNGKLLGYKDRHARLLNNQFCVAQSQVIKRDHPRRFAFIVRLHDDKSKIIERTFCAQSDSDREKWIRAFEQVKSAHERSLLEPTDLANFVDLALGKTCRTKDDFSPIRKLGKGAFGNVYLVQDESKKHYAMKVIPKSRLINAKEKEHLRQERSILERSNFPFLITLEFAFQTSTDLYMVMEYAAGGELLFHLQRAAGFNEERARFYAEEIVIAIEHLHSINVIYRDLKLENILLDREGHIKLVDFGLSKSLLANEKTLTQCGTPENIAPEVINNEYYLSGYGKEIDWWALGVVLYAMICNSQPFGSQAQGIGGLYSRILYDDPDFRFAPRRTRREAKDLIHALLNKDPQLRLGHLGADEVKDHEFFVGTNWAKVSSRTQNPPPFVPCLSSSDDVSNFDDEFTQGSFRLSLNSKTSSLKYSHVNSFSFGLA